MRPAPGSGARWRGRWAVRKLISYAVAVALVLAGWHLTALMVASPALPTPVQTVPVLLAHLPEILPAFRVSLCRVLAATAIASVLAIPLGIIVGRTPALDAAVAPSLYILYPIPKIVLLPVLLVLLGLGDASKVALMSLTIFFQVLVGVRDAARLVPEGAVLSARSLGATRAGVLAHVVVPAVLPQIFTSLRVGAGTAVAVLFLAEAIAGSTGLGYFIVNAWSMIDYPAMFAGIVAMAVLGVCVYEAFNLAERLLTPWRRRG